MLTVEGVEIFRKSVRVCASVYVLLAGRRVFKSTVYDDADDKFSYTTSFTYTAIISAVPPLTKYLLLLCVTGAQLAT